MNLFASHPPGAPEDPRPASDRRPPTRTTLWNYLVSQRYADTVIHGLFHFVVIMLAFVVANVWAGREAVIRDIRGQYAFLILIENELAHLQVYAARLSQKPLRPCRNGFTSEEWSTRQWDSMRPEDLSYLLANREFYNKLTAIYDDLRSRAGQSASVTGAERCKALWDGASKRLNAFRATMISHRNDLQRQYESYQGYRALASTTNVRIYAWTLAALAVVILLPVVLQAFEDALRRVLTAVASTEDRAEHAEPPAEVPPSAVAAAAPPVGPAAESPPHVPRGDGATTTGS